MNIPTRIGRRYDAHNHLQDERLKAQRTEILRAIEQERVEFMVVNGSCESDWGEVR
jgi:Tat protein secretion system quality control protein TatD with DNase activity